MRRSSGYHLTGSQSQSFLSTFWHNNKKVLLITGITLTVLIVSLGAGLGVGRKGSSDTADTSSTTAPDTNYSSADATNYNGWQPGVGTSWQIELIYALNDTSADAEVFDIDLFTNTAETITKLHALGKKVICYFSAGSYEDFRPDSSQFKPTDYGKALDGWPGEWWLNTNSSNVRAIMLSRMDMAMEKGCDGVDPDNIDGYDNDTGLKLSEGTAVEYLTFLASGAHTRNLSIGLKNGGTIVGQTLSMMQWEINEQCQLYSECTIFRPFIAAGKPVFHIEYPSSAPNVNATAKAVICDDPEAADFSTVLKNMNLDNWLDTC